ncbi:hypothetical protein GOP47_0017098 [Adiantum capillus-veneris]|uniref:Uncharacterized protein n=1 Tax=Adiantum capillus-veneris TaxID=13818 RepID=A0A9D4ZAX8_ADICA|nr:hypothetical protein GOP47_0017098 [Adiantum capillus-veneris]
MAPSAHLLVPDSSVKALILQGKASSSPSSSIDSPTTEPSLPPSSPSEGLYNPNLDLTLPSSSSSSCSLVPEIVRIPEHEGPQKRRKKKKKQSEVNRHNYKNGNMDPPIQLKQQKRGSADFDKKRKGCQDNVCCKCLAGFTADCAAVCCCPLALLHLAALTFIRLPAALAWKMLVNLKNRIYTKSQPAGDGEDDSPRPKFSSPWSYGSSPEGNIDLRNHRARFDNQNLWQHFDAGRLDFGGLSMRREPQ